MIVTVSSSRFVEALTWLQAHGAKTKEGRISIEQSLRWLERDDPDPMNRDRQIDLRGFMNISKSDKMLFKLTFSK